MNHDPKIRNLLLAILAAAAVMLGTAAVAGATNDRPKPPCTTTTTTTTLPPQECPEPEVCDPVLPCPDVPACPPVTCEATCQDGDKGEDGRSAPPVIVQVDRCPEPEVSEVCKVRKNGSVVCPRSRAGKRGKPGPRKIYVPRSIIDKIADVERY